MDVYVVLDELKGSYSVVLGVATEETDARVIADRGAGDLDGRRWGPWRVGPVGDVAVRHQAGDEKSAARQVVVRTPLAGVPRAGSGWGMPVPRYVGTTIPSDSPSVDPLSQVYADNVRLADQLNGIWRRRISGRLSEIEEIGRHSGGIVNDVFSAQPAEFPTVDRMQQVMHELSEKRTAIDAVRVGGGPAWEWLKAGLDRLATHPSRSPMPDSRAAAMIWGIPVLLDPNMPDDEIRMGDVVFVIGTDGGLVPAGQVIRIDKGVLGGNHT